MEALTLMMSTYSCTLLPQDVAAREVLRDGSIVVGRPSLAFEDPCLGTPRQRSSATRRGRRSNNAPAGAAAVRLCRAEDILARSSGTISRRVTACLMSLLLMLLVLGVVDHWSWRSTLVCGMSDRSRRARSCNHRVPQAPSRAFGGTPQSRLTQHAPPRSSTLDVRGLSRSLKVWWCIY